MPGPRDKYDGGRTAGDEFAAAKRREQLQRHLQTWFALDTLARCRSSPDATRPGTFAHEALVLYQEFSPGIIAEGGP